MAEDRLSQHINTQLRAVRARTFSPEDSAGINAAIREAAGYGPPVGAANDDDQDQAPATTTDPRTASGRLLADATEAVRESEPIPGLATDAAYHDWLWSRPVITLLDQHGRLPGERGYRASTTGTALGSDFDPQAAIDARRDRWHTRGR